MISFDSEIKSNHRLDINAEFYRFTHFARVHRPHETAHALFTLISACAFVIRCFDRFGNDTCEPSGIRISPTFTYVDVGGGAEAGAGAAAALPRPQRVHVGFPLAPGTVPISFTPTRTGLATLSLSVNELELDSSPFEVAICAGAPSALRSRLSGEGLEGCVALRGGPKRQLRLVTADVFNNPCTRGGAAWR